MINIEKISEEIFSADIFSYIDTTQRLKAQYGFSIVLSIVIEFVLAASISYFVGTFNYLWVMMITALISKRFIEGQHCTSFSRCAVFTCTYFIGASLIMKYIHNFNNIIIGITFVLVCTLNFSILNRQNAIKSIKFITISYILMIPIYFIQRNFIIYMLCISFSHLLKIFSSTQMGKSFIIYCDNLLIKLGIQ